MVAKTPEDQLEEGVRILRSGGIIAFPTDTVYGLGADIFNPVAVEKIYEIKGRPRQLALPLFVADLDQFAAVTEPARGIALFLAQRFWPGGLTLVLPGAGAVPAYLSQGDTIAVRMPDSPICLFLIRSLGRPITGTSANISGYPPALTPSEVRLQLGERIDFVIEGECSGGRESTIVDVASETPLILRQGIVSSAQIERAIKEYEEGGNPCALL
ncbi:MAG: threonylcarbamoyl-AMP synthase [Dehalococcoidia bacterium]|nr:threonylcarbamoyl-AMP synthase [Dehalococcoidia bacterium]